MTAVIPSITYTDVMTAMRAFILGVVDCEVVREQTNRVPMPLGDFIALNIVGSSPLETNTDTYDGTSKTILRPTQITVQVDCYGSSAGERAQTLATLLRDDYAVQAFKASGHDIVPLYAENAQQMPLITGEEQYLQRWTFHVELQYNPTLTLSQEFETAVPVVTTIEVDTTYPP